MNRMHRIITLGGEQWGWPDDQAYLAQGSEFYDQSNFFEALADFRQACELNPDDGDEHR